MDCSTVSSTMYIHTVVGWCCPILCTLAIALDYHLAVSIAPRNMFRQQRSQDAKSVSEGKIRVEGYVLQLDRCIDQRLAKEDMCGVDQIEPRRVCFGVKEEALLL